MPPMYVIFIAERPFIIASTGFQVPDEFENTEEVLPQKFFRELPFMLMQKRPEKGRICFVEDIDEAWERFKSHFVLITAAGGVVQNDQGEVLFIYRNGKWDLPKGKTEKGENAEECALREVKEECGILKLKSKGFLLTNYHTYTHINSFYLKQTDWFAMRCPSGQMTTPQTEEGITEIKWFSPEDLAIPMANTYNSIVRTLRTFLSSKLRF